MFISVVVAVRNEAKHIRGCIESLANQDYENYEIIVVDGMSDDGTYEILKELQKKYDFKLFRNDKKNAAAGRNIGIEKAKGDVIAFIDGDAIASRQWLSSIKKVMEEKEVAGVGGPDLLPENAGHMAKIIGIIMTSPLARGGKLNPSTQHIMMERERYVRHIPTCNLAIRKEIFYEVGLFDENFVKGQDLELNYRITKAGYKLFYSPAIQVVHHRKDQIPLFARQIYKWAKAKVAIIRKHGIDGIVSHVYLWPVYLLFVFLILFSFCLFFNLTDFLLLILFLVGITYLSTILFESARLSTKFSNAKLFLCALILFPVIHISYTYGVMVALMRKKIW